MAAKTLIRSGALLMNRFLSKPTTNLVKNNLRSFQQIAPQGPELPPNSRNVGFSTHLVSFLEFFLPEVDPSSEPLLLFPKRTFQPSTISIKTKATKGGRRVIARRIAKGRHRVTA
ncbi:hypothetical protein Bca52824_066619 [Brassica carinata]|uniref:Uncharacterized protein n=1 Tax=Brassica carinata TaxID=52824 RepID=A0A8X7QRI6_BRACI|nr:hypothetical protein Bca52824_066619 [Brassica carinata]